MSNEDKWGSDNDEMYYDAENELEKYNNLMNN